MDQEVGGSNPPNCTKIQIMSENKKLNPELPSGFKDRINEELLLRDEIISLIKNNFILNGFDQLETSSFEYSDVIGKFLPDQDRPQSGVFSIKDENDWISLRYDLTAPLARYVAKNYDLLPRPFKRFQVGQVWRNEKPGPGRFREFIQFDIDIVGDSNVQYDADLCLVISDTLNKIGLKNQDFKIRINNRKLLQGLLEDLKILDYKQIQSTLRAIDKLDRVGIKGVELLLGDGRKDKSGDFTKGAELKKNQIDKIISFLDFKDFNKITPLNEIFSEGIKELIIIKNYFELFNFKNFIFDPTVVRGLDYYTGPIFEANLSFKVKNEKNVDIEFGSIGGGGRYDKLVNRFKNLNAPATGFSIGIDRLIYALLQYDDLKIKNIIGPIVICNLDEAYLGYYRQILSKLRDANICSEIYLGKNSLKNQLKYADKRKSPYVIICGEDEVKNNEVTIKNLKDTDKVSDATNREDWKSSSKQKKCSIENFLKEIKI